MRMKRVSVIGSGQCEPGSLEYVQALELGRLLAEAGFEIVCGGLFGVMEAVCKGARKADGRTVGIVPGCDAGQTNEWIETPIATGLGQMRNALVVMNGDMAVAVGGGYGTLSEVALAKKSGKTVVAIGEMSEVDGVIRANSPQAVLEIVIKELGRN